MVSYCLVLVESCLYQTPGMGKEILSSLYILDIYLLSDVHLPKIFSHFKDYLFMQIILPFVVLTHFYFIVSHLLSVSLVTEQLEKISECLYIVSSLAPFFLLCPLKEHFQSFKPNVHL